MSQGQKLEVWCAGNDWCPITATAELLGKKWHTVIIHRLLESQPIGFNDLKREVDGISSKVLSESLDDLRENGLVERKQVSEQPKRVKYSLTEAGEQLEPVIIQMKNWAESNLEQPSK